MQTNYRGLVRLGIMFVVLPLILYRLCISQTVKIINEFKFKQIEKNEILGRESSWTENHVTIDGRDGILDGSLLNTLQKFADSVGIVIERYTPYVDTQEQSVNISTVELLVSGSYRNVLQMINMIEVRMLSYKILSLNCIGSTDRRTKQKQLKTTIVAQKITVKR